jgi:hypothetical protein
MFKRQIITINISFISGNCFRTRCTFKLMTVFERNHRQLAGFDKVKNNPSSLNFSAKLKFEQCAYWNQLPQT